MAFTPATTPDITETIPAAFSSRLASKLPSMRDIRFDLLVGGIGFCINPDQDSPYIRQSVPTQKDQQDNSKEPGEQSLDGLWIRSQNSWHRGAGVNYYEPGSDPDTEYRFTESSGVDIWTKGQLTSLHKTTNVQAAPSRCFVQDAGKGYLVYVDDFGGILGWGTKGSYTLNTNANAGYIGRYYFFGWKKYIQVGWAAFPSATIGIWNGGTDTVIAKNATKIPYVWYLKDRLIVAHGKDLFEVPLNAATPVDLSVTTNNLYSPTDANTTWVGAAEGPNAVYAAWTDGSRSGLVAFTLTDASSGQSPKLSQGYQVLDLPVGENINAIYGYLGRYLVISTSRGLRVCAIDSNGNLIMGQLLYETTDQFTCFAAWGNYVYAGGASIPAGDTTGTGNLAGWGTTSGVVRINLGEPTGNDANALTFAYANDLRSGATGTVSSIAFNQDGTLEMAVDSSGIWRESSLPEPKGYLAMGRVRFGTLVPKVYRSIDMGGAMGPDAAFTIKLHDELERPYYSLTMNAATGIFPTLMLDLTRTHAFVRPVGFFTTTTSEPLLNLLQLRGLPAPGRIRQIRFPLRCYDSDMDGSGNAFGYEGFAYDRLSALEGLEESGDPILLVDNRTGETFSATIDEIRYHGSVAPDRYNTNFSGNLSLTVTKLS